jgi:flagella basal body P-ring formation protein FlgA
MMKSIFLFSLCMPLIGWASSKGTVRFSEFSSIPAGQEVTLIRTAIIEVEDSALFDRLAQVRVAETLKPNETVSVSAQVLARELRKVLEFKDLQRVQIKMPENITLVGNALAVSEIEFRQRYEREAKRYCPSCEFRLTDLKLPSSQTQLASEAIFNFSSVKQPGAFLVSSTVGPVTGRAEWLRPTPIAKRLLNQGTILTSSDFTIEKLSVQFTKDSVLPADELVGKSVIRQISVGQAILAGDVKEAEVVSRGQPVRVIMGTSQLEISTPAIAEQNGARGEFIRVRLQDSNRVMSGRVTDSGVVRIE